MRRIVTTANIRALPPAARQRARQLFERMVKRSGVEVSMTHVPGELFALLERGRVAGAIWIKTWPGKPRVGDIHIASSKFRFRDYDSIVALDRLLMNRADIMGLDEWQLVVSVEDAHVVRTLMYLKFRVVSQQSFPVIGECVILKREVI
jgi:hypothetical protein